jgi:hypothetical protein
MSGNPIGPKLHLSFSQYHFLRSNAAVISEIVYTGNIGNSAGFPTVRYNPALEFPSSSGPWAPAANAHEVESSDRTCRYAIKVVASNDVKTGIDSVINAPTCYSAGATLW